MIWELLTETALLVDIAFAIGVALLCHLFIEEEKENKK